MKTFATLTIRNLDSIEHAQTVKIMNDIMERFGIKTGQEIFEKAIYQYDYLKRQLADSNLKFNEVINGKDREIKELEIEVERYKSFYNSYMVMNEVYLSIWQKNELNINN